MKCQHCEKPATFHITELIGAGGPHEMHLCEEHARAFLNKDSSGPVATIAGQLAKQLKLGGKSPAEVEVKECPVCGISFFEFRNSGRLGCPYDYTHFEKELEPLLLNIHDASSHTGKHPKRAAVAAEAQATIIRLRREMEEAIEREDYEQASTLRDQIRQLEDAGKS